jgi:hypothetical protein
METVETIHTMHFVMSLTWSASEIRKAAQLWEEKGDDRNPFAHILVSPLFAGPSIIKEIRELKERWNSQIYFDSGGYYVQQGRISYPALRERLYEYYMKPENQWADYYVLPDHVPTSTDSEQEVQSKVYETCTVATQFFHQLPSALQERALPVIQGHTAQQIYTCVETYARLSTPQVGFGSFGTSGATNSINMMTNTSYQMLTHVRNSRWHFAATRYR